MSHHLGKGMIAGFAATVLLSGLMLIKAAMGVLPELDIATMLGSMMGDGPAMGWLGHFFIGTVVWGGLFARLSHHLPGGSHWLKGITFAMGAWLLMMIMVMPMAGAGLFAVKMGPMAAVMTAVLHAIFGAVLGGTYGAMLGSDARPSGA